MYTGLSIVKYDSLFEVSNNSQRPQSQVSQTSLPTESEEVFVHRKSHPQMEFS